MGSDSDSEPDDRKADFDVELNKKVATVMAPLMKKLRKQGKRIEVLEEQVALHTKAREENEPKTQKDLQDLRTSIEEGLDRCRRDIGERVLHADHARVEVAVSSGLEAAHRTSEEVRTRLASIELTVKALQTRVDEVEALCKRGLEGSEERVAALRTTFNDETVRSDARRSELQLHIAEVSAKLHAELVEARRETDQQLHKLTSGVAAAAKRAEVLERFSALEEAEATARGRVDRQQGQLASLEERTAEAEAVLRTRAAQVELQAVRDEADRRLSLSATSAGLAEVIRENEARETQWERRHLAVEHTAAASLRESRQMAANIEEVGRRLADYALVGDLDELRQALSVVSKLADKEALESVVRIAQAAASKEEVEKLQVEHERTASGLQMLVDGTNARFELAADAETQRKIEGHLSELRRQLDSKLSVTQAEKMLEHKADATQVQKATLAGGSASTELAELASRLAAAEDALSTARREAAEATERSASSASALAQMQSATDKHWQITRTAREEQQQLVKAVRALLLDAELRVNAESAATNAPPSASKYANDLMETYGRHGWSSPAARHAHAGAGGGSAAAPPLPRVAVAAANAANAASGGSCCASPKRTSSVSKAAFLPSPPADGSSVDVLDRRRRLLAGVSMGGMGGGDVTLPESLALPGSGAPPASSLSTRTRTRITMANEPYPSLAASGVLAPMTQ